MERVSTFVEFQKAAVILSKMQGKVSHNVSIL